MNTIAIHQTEQNQAEHIVRAYHTRTKHRFEAFAAGPGTLDWDAQPAAFRHFEGTTSVQLPVLTESLQDTALVAALNRPFFALNADQPALPLNLTTLGALLHLALGITAWKSYGPDRWAVRANPSSGNLHPIEAYVVIGGMENLADGIYHYRPENHALEYRASLDSVTGNTPRLQIALSSVMWREAWKYGERAFRYCQLDSGHAVGALAYAANVLGWSLSEQRDISTDTLAHWLGLDRAADFPARRHAETEREEAEILLTVHLNNVLATNPETIASNAWQGIASTIDAHPIFRWPVIEEVAVASRCVAGAAHAETKSSVPKPDASNKLLTNNLSTNQLSPTAATVILGRRSAQRFDASHVMPAADFFAMLAALIPSATAPWNALATQPHINLLLFVHRVAGLQPGVYLLLREPSLAAQLDSCLNPQFLRQPVSLAPAHLNFQLLTEAPSGELHRAARSLHCHQDIAANACFAIGMLAEFDTVIAQNASNYRDLHREAGLIGQVLYLQAEALGLRGTGIGCFFDDPVHQLLGFSDQTFQTIYHFTVGLPLEDQRIETQTTFLPTPTSTP